MTPAQVFIIAGGHQRQAAAQYGGTTSLPQGAARHSDTRADLAQLAGLTFG